MNQKKIWLGMLAMALVLGITVVGCDDDPTNGTTVPQTVSYESIDASGNTYTLTITEKTDRAVYVAKAGDAYVLVIVLVSGVNQTSRGIVQSINVSAGLTLLPAYANAPAFTVTISGGNMTAITGPITLEGGGTAPAPESLTPVGGGVQDCVVTFDLDGGAIDDNTDSVTITVKSGETLEELPSPHPQKAEYIFGGWFTEKNGAGTEFTATTTVTSKITVYAKWTSKDTFVAVQSITDVPETGAVGNLTLNGTVNPLDATNKTIVWSIAIAGTTGATISGNILTTTAAGTVTVTATIANGTAVGTDYTQNFEIVISEVNTFVAVQSITGVPQTGTVGNLTLTGTVYPDNATNQTIVWSVASAGTTGATISGNVLTTTAAGTVTVKATIANGTADGTDFTRNFNIVISNNGNPSAFTSIAEMAAWLSAQPANTAATPYTVKLNVSDISDIHGKLYANQTKYVNLDLSGSTITVIGESVGYFEGCTSLVGIIIPNSVTDIEDNVFGGCTSLASITIPASVTSIGHAFYLCTSLTAINVDPANASFNSENDVLYNKDKTKLIQYPAGKAGSTFTIPNSVTSIEQNAFGYSNLASVTIPNSVTSIGSLAFYECGSLTSITIPASVTSIGSLAFNNCSSLTSVTFAGTIASGEFDIFYPFPGDLRTKFYATDATNGTPGTYTTTAPVSTTSVWTKS